MVTEIVARITEAKRPFVLLVVKFSKPINLGKLSEQMSLPIGTSFSVDFIDNRHPNYMGDVGLGINPKLKAYIKSAD